jgi:putative drug exporter of the RND superfamily
VVRAQITGPVPAADGRAIQTVVPVDLGKDGWNAASPAAESLRAIAVARQAGSRAHNRQRAAADARGKCEKVE